MKKIAALPIDDNLAVGIDIGIGSSALAVLGPKQISSLHVRCFSVPETADKKELLNAIRRTKRLMRRQINRRRRRRNDLARLFSKGLLIPLDKIKRRDVHDPWAARVKGLDEALQPLPFISALMHIAKRRGFLSNSKKAVSGNSPEGGKALKGMAEMDEKSQRYRTIGEMFFTDDEFKIKKRNSSNNYSHTISRKSAVAEAKALFVVQRKHNAKFITAELEKAYFDFAFFQRPLQASEHLVGDCPFEAGEKRASSFAPSFERFRYLSKVNTLSVIRGEGQGRGLSEEEVRRAADLFGTKKSITYKHLRKAFPLSDDETFSGIPREKPKKGSLWEGSDVCRSKGACAGTMALRKLLSERLGKVEWDRLLSVSELLDNIAFTITFREEIRFSGHGEDESIERGLRERGITEEIIALILVGVEKGAFKDFKGAGHLSAKATRAINPYLEKAQVYSEACEAAGYDHSAQVESRIENVANPVVRQVLKESLRLFEAVIRKTGKRPGRITIEMARDVGKPVEVRKDITRALGERRRNKADLREQYADLVRKEPTDDELLAYQLWKEQKHCCIYSGETISPADLDLSRRKVEIDHALPRSRSQDNSYHNKVLCMTAMNQAKKNRSPYEWMMEESHPRAFDWEEFTVWVESLSELRGMKKRNVLMRNFAEREQTFVSRNLNDTRYACRVFRSMLERFYLNDRVNPKSGQMPRRIFTRPGPITAIVRRAWGLERLKKTREGERVGDLHHAVDAAIVAALGTDEALTQSLTRIHQKLEGRGLAKNIPGIQLPWDGFRDDLETALQEVFVSRPESRSGTGEGHEATIRRVTVKKDPKGQIQKTVYERKDIGKVTKQDLDKLDAVRQRDLIQSIAAWMDEDKKTRAPYPCMPLNDDTANAPAPEIHKIRLPIVMNSGVEVRGGFAGNGKMVRTDVFQDEAGYWLVPIYAHQVADKGRFPKPPFHACIAFKPLTDWRDVSSISFLFSLYSWSFVRLVNRKGEVHEGYFRGINISVATISVSPHFDASRLKSFGVKKLAILEKYHIDLLGDRSKIKGEPQLWHGEASI